MKLLSAFRKYFNKKKYFFIESRSNQNPKRKIFETIMNQKIFVIINIMSKHFGHESNKRYFSLSLLPQ